MTENSKKSLRNDAAVRHEKSQRISGFLSTLAVAWHVYSLPLILSMFLLACATRICWPFVLAYLIYFLVDNTSENGCAPEHSSYFLRSSPFWKYFAAYFPLVLHKTCELEPAFVLPSEDPNEERGLDEDDDISLCDVQDEDIQSVSTQSQSHESPNIKNRLKHNTQNANSNTPAIKKSRLPGIILSSTEFDDRNNYSVLGVRQFFRNISNWIHDNYNHQANDTARTGKQYIFGYHPHGIIGMGAVGGIATEGANWSKMFPGIPVTALTLVNQFKIPLCREYLLSLGLSSVSKHNCQNLLRRGQSICILLGGAQESLLAVPGSMDLVLRKRQGFVKLAMNTPGTEIVPVLAFGENSLYDQVQKGPQSFLYKAQTYLKNLLGFTLPLINARGMFNYHFGIIPYHRAINIVVGKPIKVPENKNPTNEEIHKVHKEYMDAVQKLFDDHKDQFHNSEALQDGIEYKELKIVE